MRPSCVLIYESGTIGAKPLTCRSRSATASSPRPPTPSSRVPEIFAYWLQAGRIDVGFLGAAQIDRFGNLNSTVIGDYDHPKVRLPGAGGAPEIAASCGETFVMLRQTPRTFVERLDFRTIGRARRRPGLARAARPAGRGVTVVVTDLGRARARPRRRAS